MIIISQNGQCIINMLSVAVIQRNDRYIHAYFPNMQPIALGLYNKEEIAQNVLSNLIFHYEMGSESFTLPEEDGVCQK